MASSNVSDLIQVTGNPMSGKSFDPKIVSTVAEAMRAYDEANTDEDSLFGSSFTELSVVALDALSELGWRPPNGVPVDAPELLTGEEIDYLAGVMHDDMHGNSDFAWSQPIVVDDVRDYRRKTIRAVIAALPERFGVRMEGTTDEIR